MVLVEMKLKEDEEFVSQAFGFIPGLSCHVGSATHAWLAVELTHYGSGIHALLAHNL